MKHTCFVESTIRQYEPLWAANHILEIENAVTAAMASQPDALQAMCAKAKLPYPATLGVLWAIACGNFDRMSPAQRLLDYQQSEAVLAQLLTSTPDNNLACTAS